MKHHRSACFLAGAIAVVALSCVLGLFWRQREIAQSMRSKGAMQRTMSSFTAISLCFGNYAMDYPHEATAYVIDSNIELTNHVFEKRLRMYLPPGDESIDLVHDGWGGEIHMRVLSLMTNTSYNGIDVKVMMWSDGPDRINNNGTGDDIVRSPFALFVPFSDGKKR
jgi:hypothetical protein